MEELVLSNMKSCVAVCNSSREAELHLLLTNKKIELQLIGSQS